MTKPEPTEKKSPRVTALETAVLQLAKGMRRAEKFAEDYGSGEAFMEKCEIQGVSFPGGVEEDADDDDT